MVEIRWAGIEDARNLGIVHSEAYRDAYKGIMTDEFLNAFIPAARETYFYNALFQGAERIAILSVDGQAAGCLILRACSDEDLHIRSGEISALYLIPDYRGNGLGKRLLDWGLAQLNELGYATAALWVLKDNEKAIRFYEKYGFRHDGAERQILRGMELSQIRYLKPLP